MTTLKRAKKISMFAAIDLAIKVLKDWRRRHYAMGEEAYKKGMDLTFAIDGHRHYVECTQAIQQLEDIKEILSDPGVTVDEYGDLPLFEQSEQV